MSALYFPNGLEAVGESIENEKVNSLASPHIVSQPSIFQTLQHFVRTASERDPLMRECTRILSIVSIVRLIFYEIYRDKNRSCINFLSSHYIVNFIAKED